MATKNKYNIITSTGNKYDILPDNQVMGPALPAAKSPSTPFASTALGVGVNTVLGLPKAAWDVSKFIADAATNLPGQILKEGTNTALDVRNAFVPESKRIFSIPAENDPLHVVPGFGTDPIVPNAVTAASYEQSLKDKGFGKWSTPIAVAGAVIGPALDFTLFGGGEKGVIEAIAKSTDKKVIAEILAKIGIHADLIPSYAEKLVATSDKKVVADALETANKLQTTTKLASPSTVPPPIEKPISQPSVPNIDPPAVYPENLYPEASGTKPQKLFNGENPNIPKSTGNPLQDTILRARAEQDALERSNITAPLPEEFPVQAKEVRDGVVNSPIVNNLKNYTDISTAKKQLRDIYRNTEEVFAKDAPVIDKLILEPFNQSKGAYIDFLNQEIKNLTDKIPFDIGSKESKFIQQYGEGKTKIDELVKEFGDVKAQQIVNADSFFRSKYDELLAKLNKIEQQIYPNSPQKWTPKRADYYRHFQDVSNDYSRLQNILENPVKIDPLLVGLSETTAPKSRWASFKQRRFGISTKNDAIGGYLDYLKSVSYAIHIDPNIGKFRELADVLARGSGAKKNVNNYIYNLRKLADNLAGKTSDLDRIITEHVPGGRATLGAVNWLNNRVKANTILFNAKSSIAQIYNVPQGIADMGPINSIKAFSKTLAQNFVENVPMKQSNFLKERYFKGFNQFDKGILNNTRKFGVWMVGALDEVGTKFIWNGEYEKAIKSGISNPVKFADDTTKKLVAGRGIGEKPLIQNSKIFQIVAPFQLEMTNLWWVMEDMAKSDKSVMKKFGQFATLFTSLYLLNGAVEKGTGTRPILDPIQATADGIKELQADPSLTGVAKAGGRLFGEALSNLPIGQTLASIYPEYGSTIAGVKIPTRKEFFGRADPTRFGGGILSSQALADPLFKILPPFGGYQLEKTIGGLKAVNSGKSTTAGGAWQYKVPQTPMNTLQAGIFGKYALPESQKYYAKQNVPKPTSKSGHNKYNII